MSKILMRLLTTTIIMLTFYITPAYADIVLEIDVISETWSLSGSDTGNPGPRPDPFQPFPEVIWNIDAFFGSQPTNQVFGNNSITSTGWTPDFSFDFLAETLVTTRYQLIVGTFDESFTGTVTISATPFPTSYAFLTPSSKTWFEGLRGTQIPEIRGTNFSPISVVPEPSAFGVLSLALAGVGFARRRRVTRQ